MSILQLDFFSEEDNVRMQHEIDVMSNSLDRQRKKLFAENGRLKKEIEELKIRVEIIEKGICKNG